MVNWATARKSSNKLPSGSMNLLFAGLMRKISFGIWVDLGFVPAVVGSRGVEREILSGTNGKGIAWCVLSDRREVARRIAAGCLGRAVSESDATLEKILHGGY